MKFKGTVSFLGRTGILTLDIPSVTDGRTTDDYRNFSPVSGYLTDASWAVKTFNEAVGAFNQALSRTEDVTRLSFRDDTEANE